MNALLLVAAMAAAATLLLSRAEGGRVRLVSTQDADALTHALDAFEALGRTLLDRDLRDGTIDSARDTWSRSTIDVPLERGRVSGMITDQQSLFNLNWLANLDDTLAQEGWPVLLRRIGIAPQKGDAIVSFVSPQGPKNSATFGRLTPPVAPLGGSIMLIDQLGSLIDFSPEDLDLLRRHATALPGTSRVNLNSASIDVLAAMLPQLSLAQLNAVVQRRIKIPYPSVDTFLEEVGLSTDPENPDAVNPERYSVESDWFGAEIAASLDTRHATRRVLYRRQSAPVGTQIVWRVSRFD